MIVPGRILCYTVICHYCIICDGVFESGCYDNFNACNMYTFLSPYDIKADWLMAHYSGSQLFVFAQRLHIPHRVVKLDEKKVNDEKNNYQYGNERDRTHRDRIYTNSQQRQ